MTSDRFVAWLSAGVLAAGLSAATLAGAGLAVAEDGAAAGADGTTASQSADSSGAQTDTDTKADADTNPDDATGDPDADVEKQEAAESDVSDDDEAAEVEVTDEQSKDLDPISVSDDLATARTLITARDFEAEFSSGNQRSALKPALKPTLEPAVADSDVAPVAVAAAPIAVAVDGDAPLTSGTDSTPAVARVVMAAAEEVQPAAGPTLINIVGTLAWSVLDFVVKLVDLPPVVPASSSVTAGRSTLQIDCGDGYTAATDWYYPKSGQAEKVIYFQHGFPARAFVYDLTLTELAERNNAVVVAPSITSNYFACDGCSLTADPMHAAVARLFDGDRAALLASATAAGFAGTLPEKFVLSGQSAGSMLAAAASGYYYDRASATEKADLVGVLLFDGSAANGALARALDKMPASVPVLHIAGEPALINNFGEANTVLLQKRPGQFNGVQLVGGSHSDAFQSSAYFGLVQAFVGLAFGASTPQNVAAVQVLSASWITDMYEGRVYNPSTRTGIYGDPGQPGQTVIDIPTEAGLARGYVLPGPTPAPSSIEQFIAALVQSINSNDFVTCSPAASATASCSAPRAQI